MNSQISPAGRRYGRIKPAPLPRHMMLEHSNPHIPDVVDLRPWCGAVKDQGEEGSCTAHTGAEAIEWMFRKYLQLSPTLSPQYLYAEELIAQGNFPEDSGSDGVTLCTTMITKGCCELSLYPYVAGQINKPTPEQEANAARYRLGAYHGLTGSAVALSVLGNAVPWPVAMGFTVDESFESDAVAKSGVVPIPQHGEAQLGGHEVLIVGYDIGAKPSIRPAGSLPSALIMNSWGSEWGLEGFCWMPLQILDAADTDLKIAHIGRPWH